MKIKHKVTGLTIMETSGTNLSEENLLGTDLSSADLSSVDLSEADLRWADLRWADLRWANLGLANLGWADLSGAKLGDANLSGAIGNNREIKTIQCGDYIVTHTDTVIQIGCEHHTIEEWWGFDDSTILAMDGKKALIFWRKWKPILQMIIGGNDGN